MPDKCWVCSNNPKHIFETPTSDYFCDICDQYTGILMEQLEVPSIKSNTNSDEPPEGGGEVSPPAKKVGLCVLLMDASDSMTVEAFEGSPLTRMRLIATSAASGIFDLKDLTGDGAERAYILGLKFDHRVEKMFFDTVDGLIQKFGDTNSFADYIHDELNSMRGATNINDAMLAAKHFVEQFVKLELSLPRHTKYNIEGSAVLLENDYVYIHNIRVLLYTDGYQYTAAASEELNPSPLKGLLTPEQPDVDILMGAFFGEPGDHTGAKALEDILAYCPNHNHKQYFLFEKPNQIGTLKNLFKMASGGSGFCPKCLQHYSGVDRR